MEKVMMNRKVRKLVLGLSMASVICLGGLTARGQSPAQRALLDKAQALEQSGHIDLAAQSWQQVLLSDPNNEEALAGLARWAKLTGDDVQAQHYIQRLRQVNPKSPEIPRIQALVSNKTQNQLLQQASELAKNGHNEEALRIYRETFGTHPPDNWAQAYYDTEAAIPSLRPEAVVGLRALTAKYPSNPQYAIDLGRVLTYDARTRAEGEHILLQYPQDASAQAVLRQALEWDVQNPAWAGQIREYLKAHPDEELERELTETEERQAKAASGFARTPAEQEAYRALAANHLDEAQRRFMALNAQQPDNARVLAGMGFLRMKQSNFRSAVQYFEQAEQNGLHGGLLEQSLATSRFWDAMQQGTEAMNANRMDDAVRAFKTAAAMRPQSSDALSGLAGAYMKAQRPVQAVPVYALLVRRQPKSAALWRGLFMAEAQSGAAKAAIATTKQFPVALSSSLVRDPEYLRTLAAAYAANGQAAEAQHVFLQALSLHYAAAQAPIRNEIMLQYAGFLTDERHYPQAAAVYQQMVDQDSENVNAWQGLVSLEHVTGHDLEAITMVEQMPPHAYENALSDGGFLSMLAAIYQGQNHPDVAQGFLERAVQLYQDKGQELPIPLQLQIAAVDLERNHPDAAYRIYRSVLTTHPDRLDAWKGLLAALHETNHDADALAQIQEIPPAVRRALDPDVEYEQTLAAIYAANGDQQAALGLAARVLAHYRMQRMLPPADVNIQFAWLLFNTGDDRDLYGQLMTLGGRTDMIDAQRRQVQTIWASWAQRRAAQAAAAGNAHRAMEILTAAARAFPGNPAVSKALAIGFMQAGQPKDAMAIYSSLDMTNAAAADYQSMVGAAIAAQNMKQAEAWLRAALAKFPNDAKVLAAAAQFEQARGDHARAADYWRASLNAMPPVSPATDLAHKLDQPDLTAQSKPAHGNDLVSLLNPDGDFAGQEATGVPLPSYRNPNPLRASNEPYGPDPYYMGSAPVPMDSIAAAPSSEASDPLANALPPMAAATGAPTAVVPEATVPGVNAPDVAVPDATPRGKRPAKRLTPEEVRPFKPLAAVPAPEAQTAMDVEPVVPAAAPVVGAVAEQATDLTAGSTSNAEEAASGVAPLHLPVLDKAAITPEAQVTEAKLSPEQPEELVLDTSPAVTEVPNASERATQQAVAALNAAKQPIDPSLSATQYAPPSREIAQEQAPMQQPQGYMRPPSILNPASAAAQTVPATGGATDEQLMDQNLPPLRGPYERSAVVRQSDLRDQAQQQLAKIEGGYSPWLGGTGFVNHRSGTAGYDSLTALEAPFEASTPIGTVARLTVIARPVFLDAGAPSTSPILPGGVVEQLGTAPVNTILSQQNATGIGGEVQLATSNFAVSAGYSPYGFLVSNVIGRLNWKPANGPVTITFNRDAIKDSQLSYAGLRDPGSTGPGFAGNIWGGVVATGGEVQLGRGDANSGYYVSAGGQYLDGAHVQTNSRIDGDVGAYWHVKAIPDEGNLTLGANFFGMHYTHNLDYFTYGQGGYFSPQAYFLANVPVTWQGQYGVNLHYSIVGAFGVQAFQEDSAPFFPLDSLLQTANNNPYYAAQTVVSGNYDLHSQIAYHLTDHWYTGAFLDMNNTRSYNNQVVGFYVRFLFRPQVSSEGGPTGLYPWDGLRPFLAP